MEEMLLFLLGANDDDKDNDKEGAAPSPAEAWLEFPNAAPPPTLPLLAKLFAASKSHNIDLAVSFSLCRSLITPACTCFLLCSSSSSHVNKTGSTTSTTSTDATGVAPTSSKGTPANTSVAVSLSDVILCVALRASAILPFTPFTAEVVVVVVVVVVVEVEVEVSVVRFFLFGDPSLTLNISFVMVCDNANMHLAAASSFKHSNWWRKINFAAWTSLSISIAASPSFSVCALPTANLYCCLATSIR